MPAALQLEGSEETGEGKRTIWLPYGRLTEWAVLLQRRRRRKCRCDAAGAGSGT
jgi:hypothetical protein